MRDAIDIGSRWELFADDFLLEELTDLSMELHHPERREVAFEGDAAWEDDIAFPQSIVQDGGQVRMYYRASIPDRGNEDQVVFAMAESLDGGRTFHRPNLGLVEFEGSRHNNILYVGEPPFVPPPAFIDTNPDCPPDQRYKGLSSRWRKLYAMASADGLEWRPLTEQPLEMEGTFDTVNTAFWDAATGCYRCFTRYFENLQDGMVEADVLGPKPTVVRAIQSATSADFLTWGPVAHHEYEDPYDDIQLYTNATIPCPGAEHLYLSFPNRYVQQRVPDPEHPSPGVNDALFMVSRDGVRWKRYAEAWVRPGPDPLNWTDRNNYPTWGIAQTSDTEWSLYITEHYRHPGTPTRLRRLSVRPRGFASVRGKYGGGRARTRPLTFAGSELHLNYATSAAGSLRVEIQDGSGAPVPGYSLDDMDPVYGDAVDGVVRWRGRANAADLAGRSVRLQIELCDADLFALRFT